MSQNGRAAFAALRRTDSGHILVEAQEADGEKSWFIVDTAAAKSVLSQSGGPYTRAAVDAEIGVQTYGAGGPASAAGTATLRSLRISSATIAPAEFVVLDLQSVAAKLGVVIDGVLGLDVLLRHGSWLDLRANLLSLSFAEPPGRTLRFEQVSYEMTGDRIIALRVSSGERSMLAVLDTGAAKTMVNLAGLRLLGSAEPDTLLDTSRALGADGASTPVRMASCPGFCIGSALFPPQQILVAEMPVFARFGSPGEAIMLLGLDSLGTRSIGLDSSASTLWIST